MAAEVSVGLLSKAQQEAAARKLHLIGSIGLANVKNWRRSGALIATDVAELAIPKHLTDAVCEWRDRWMACATQLTYPHGPQDCRDFDLEAHNATGSALAHAIAA